jgi:hypothetical protein
VTPAVIAHGGVFFRQGDEMYFYRCTEQQLNDALQHIYESGDTLHSAVFKGGRDWVLIVFKAKP